jgi:hypothetical protein
MKGYNNGSNTGWVNSDNIIMNGDNLMIVEESFNINEYAESNNTSRV